MIFHESSILYFSLTSFWLSASFYWIFIDFRILSSSYHELSCMPWLVACNFSLLVPISWRKHSGPYRLRVGLLLLEERFIVTISADQTAKAWYVFSVCHFWHLVEQLRSQLAEQANNYSSLQALYGGPGRHQDRRENDKLAVVRIKASYSLSYQRGCQSIIKHCCHQLLRWQHSHLWHDWWYVDLILSFSGFDRCLHRPPDQGDQSRSNWVVGHRFLTRRMEIYSMGDC